MKASSENALILWARGLSERAAAEPIVRAATATAAMLEKVVVQSTEEAARVTGLLDTVRKGRLAAKKSLEEILRDPKSAIVEAKSHLDPVIHSLEEVEAAGKASVARFLLGEQERCAKEEREARLAAEKASKASDLPVMEVEVAAPASIVRSESGASVHLVKRLRVEMLNAAEVAEFDQLLLKLVDSDALAAYRHYSNGEAPPEGSKSCSAGGVEWHGMRFWEESSVAQRGSR